MKETLIDIFSNIGVTDVLDICVVAFIVYKILAFIRESRAQQLVKGIDRKSTRLNSSHGS